MTERKVLSVSHRGKLSASHKGKKHSPETISKIRQANIGKTRSQQTIDNIKKGHERIYVLTSPEGHEIIIGSLMLGKFCQTYGLNKGSLLNARLAGKSYKSWLIRLQ